MSMPHATVHGVNGRGHDFEGTEISVGILFGGQTLELPLRRPKSWRPRTSEASLLDVPPTSPSAKPRFELRVAAPAPGAEHWSGDGRGRKTYDEPTNDPAAANPPVILIGAPTDIGAGHRSYAWK